MITLRTAPAPAPTSASATAPAPEPATVPRTFGSDTAVSAPAPPPASPPMPLPGPAPIPVTIPAQARPGGQPHPATVRDAAWLRLWMTVLGLAFVTGAPLPEPPPRLLAVAADQPRRTERAAIWLAERLVAERAVALRGTYPPAALAHALAGAAKRMLAGELVLPRAGALWVIPQLRWAHEATKVGWDEGGARPDEPAAPLDFAIAGLPDWPGILAGQRLDLLLRHPMTLSEPANRVLATTALFGEDGQAAFCRMLTDDLALVCPGDRSLMSGTGHAGSPASAPSLAAMAEATSLMNCCVDGLPRGLAHRVLAVVGERIASAAMDNSFRDGGRIRLPMRARIATTVGGAAATVSRLTGRDGSVIGGIVGLRLEPDLLSVLARGRQIVLVTGTNGKTTTTRLITAALGPLGQEIASNVYGANMEAGLTSALSRAPGAPLGVLETDEKYIPAMVRATRPRVVVLLNLSRDQMDRAAEIWLLARRWREALANAPGCRVVANADDPLVAWAASGAEQVTWVAAGQRWREDSWCCPHCGAHLRRDGDDWACRECPNRRPPVSWVLAGENMIDPSGQSRPIDLALPGRANRSNAVIALAVADAFGVKTGSALRALGKVTSVAGRYTQVSRHGTKLRLLLAKNPAGWLEALDVLVPAPVPVLLAVNAQGPDGKDTSWLWDVDYRRLRNRPVLVGGERKTDLAVRLEADEVPFRLVDDIDEAIGLAGAPHIEVLANYTAFQQYRAVLGRTE